MKRRAYAVLFVLWAASGCVPITFSREPALDFEIYRHAAVQVSLAGFVDFYDDTSASVYLASELDEQSGFERVSVGSTEAADVLLTVNVTVRQWVDDSGDYPDYSYASDASFRATDRNGVVIDSGHVADSSESPGEAVEDALDEVSLHYLRPYRL
ncbi:MAG TPA: hypothetical protein VI197_26530 [Polyangiaceae bacterium]